MGLWIRKMEASSSNTKACPAYSLHLNPVLLDRQQTVYYSPGKIADACSRIKMFQTTFLITLSYTIYTIRYM